jgi:hypothetical protein
MAAYLRGLEDEDGIAAFLLALREGSACDSQK